MAGSRRARLCGLVVAATAVVGIGAIGIRALSSPPAPADPLVAQLEQLRGENDLYVRPGLLGSAGEPSIADSAYGLGLLAAAGQPSAAPWQSPVAVTAARAAADDSSVWGSW